MRTTLGAAFSGAPATPAGPLAAFTLGVAQRRQVVMLQITEVDTQVIDQQRFYHGFTLDEPLRASNARGISVWAAEERSDTRVAICGETYDATLPLSQGQFLAATATAPTGFIAVFDGLGTLLWTRHFYGVDASQSCAITDVSIRVDAQGNDVVTYCGISTHGVPLGATPLSPVAAVPAFGGDSSGFTDQGIGQWDGIVGRVTVDPLGAQTPNFHSIVSGPEQDGLFGLAEIEEGSFAVVGCTSRDGTALPAAGFAFPAHNLPGPFYQGVVMTFRSTAGSWALDAVTTLGSFAGTFTIARDVLVLRDGLAQFGTDPVTGAPVAVPGEHMLAVVGSTNDANVLAPLAGVLQGATDGFAVVLIQAPGTLTPPVLGSFHGGPGDDGLTGVQGWNEYPDHFVVTGFTSETDVDGFGVGGSTEITVEAFFVDLVAGQLRSLRRAWSGGSSEDRPAVMGGIHATTVGLPFQTGPALLLGPPAGGGIAVDQRSRVNVVGQTLSTDYFQTLTGRPFNADSDAVRTVFDMIPEGVGRTDGTGFQGTFVLPAGFTGGTTPACALSPFGKRINDPPVALPRILLDLDGPEPQAGATGVSLLVVRPTAPIVAGTISSSAVFAGFQFNFPGAVVPPILLGDLELFVTDNPPIYTVGFGNPNEPIVFPLLPLPNAPGQIMTVQVLCVVPSLIQGGCANASDLTASPALWMTL